MEMPNVRKKVSVVGAILVLFSVIVLPVVVSAQATNTTPGGSTTRPPLSLTTSPIPLSVITSPGKTVTADIRVKNNSTRSEVLKIELLKFGANGESGSPQLQERGPKDDYFSWVTFSENSFTAEPGVWKTVKMTIKTPQSAAFGYYLAVLFSRATPDKPTGGASAFEGGVASLVLLDVETPGAKREAKLANFTATRKVYEFLPADLNVRLSNPGNVHVAPTGTIFIKRGNTQVAELDFNPQRGNILPGSKRLFESSWNDGFPKYEEKTEGNTTTRSLKWNFNDLQKLRIGRYTATLVAVYDNGKRDIPVEATVTFWVMPWRILGVTLLVLLLIFGGIFASLRGVWKTIRRPHHDRSKYDDTDQGGNAGGGSPAPVSLPPAVSPQVQPVKDAPPDASINPASNAEADSVAAKPKAPQAGSTPSAGTPNKPPTKSQATPRTAPPVPGIDPESKKPKTAPELKD